MNKTIFIAAMLAVATLLAAGLTVLPSSVQEAQANPCATEIENDLEIDSDGDATQSSSTTINSDNDNRECNFGPGPVEIDED